MSDLIQDKAKELTTKISGQMDAHLFESIISLFTQGVLKHYVRSPRVSVDINNFKMSVDAASGVMFEGREKIIELEERLKDYESGFKGACPTCEIVGEVNVELNQKLAEQSELLAKAVEGLKFYADTAKWHSKNSLIQQSLFYDGADSEVVFKQGIFYGGKRARQILKELGE